MDVKKTLEKYDRKLAQDAKIAELNRKAREGMRKWQAAQELASRTGMTAAEVLLSDLLEEYPDGKIPEEAAKALTVPVVKHNYNRVSEVAEAVQEAVNEEAGVGLKPVVPEFNADRAEGMAKNISSWENLAEHLGAVTKEIENNSMSIIDDTIRENAELHERVGLEPRVTRIYDGVGVHNRKHECKWCKERCGENMGYREAYEKGAFQRHPGCGCELLYTVGKRTQRQTDWTNNIWEDLRERSIGHNSTILLQTDISLRNNSYGEMPKSFSERGIELPDYIQRYLRRLKRSGDYISGGADDFSKKEVSTVAVEAKVEFAKVTLPNKTYLIRGTAEGTIVPEELLKELKMYGGKLDFHCHPFNGDIIPSVYDLETMEKLEMWTGQKTSQIISADGRVATFSKYGIIDVVETIDNTITEEDRRALEKLFGD